jgi:phosphoglycolate phosphatase
MIIKKSIIYDFDGVIADSKQAIYEAICYIADDRKVTPPTIEELQNNSSAFLFSHFSVKWYELPFVVQKLKRRVAENRKLIIAIPDVLEMLKISKETMDNVHILSSNSTDFIKLFLKENSLDTYIDTIQGDTAFFKKKSKLKALLKQYDLDPQKSFYVGNETRDVDAANEMNIKSVAVTWGMHSKDLLVKSKPNFLIESPSELIDIVLDYSKKLH